MEKMETTIKGSYKDYCVNFGVIMEIMENKKETTIVYRDSIAIMENKMEATIVSSPYTYTKNTVAKR